MTDEGFAASEFLDPRDLVQVKYEMVRRVRVEGDVFYDTLEGGWTGQRVDRAREVANTVARIHRISS